MKQLILSGMFVVCGLSVSLASEKWAVDSINWHRAEQKMQEKDFQDAALTYKELIMKGDSLFVDYAGRHVEDMREQYSIDELDLQNGMQQKKIWKLVFITILCLVVFISWLILERNTLLLRTDSSASLFAFCNSSLENRSFLSALLK